MKKNQTKSTLPVGELAYANSNIPLDQHVSSSRANASIVTRESMSREIYNKYRPDEAVPEWGDQYSQQEIMKSCTKIYRRVGVVRNTVDAMSEWIADGVRLIYSAPAGQKFLDDWSVKVGLKDRVERFANWILRSGNVVVRRRFGRLRGKNIPTGYIFYDPSFVEVKGEYLAGFTAERKYSIRILNSDIVAKRYAMNPLSEEDFNTLPEELKIVLSGNNKKSPSSGIYVDIPPDAVYAAHYKKDDTDIWATPFIYSIMQDVYYNDKLALAKTSMLDGMINPIRIFKLGNIEKDILPTPAMAANLHSMLKKNTGGGPIDIVWDDMIAMETDYPPIENLQHMEPNMDAILWGLGIHVVSNDINDDSTPLGIRELVNRVQYVRDLVNQWLNAEFALITEATGFRGGQFGIHYTYADFTTEETYRRLMLELVDRNIIPDKRLQEILRENYNLNTQVVKQENDERESGIRPPKAGPYHNADMDKQHEHRKDEMKLGQKLGGTDTPGPGPGPGTKKAGKTGKPGRPPSSKDSTPRKRVKKSFSEITLELTKSYNDIYDNELLLAKKSLGKSDIRSFTSLEKANLEKTVNSQFWASKPSGFEDVQINLQELDSKVTAATKILGIDSTLEQKQLCLITAAAEYWYETQH